MRHGRIDVLISSTDKNFMVPVGGSIVYGPKKKDSPVQWANKAYPGRASGGPIVDLFLTLIEMGELRLRSLLRERKDNFTFLKEQLTECLSEFNERVLETPGNKISIASTLEHLPASVDPTFIGSYLFSRKVSGLRVVKPGAEKEVGGIPFTDYGSHSSAYTHLPYFTTAAAIGGSKAEIELFIKRLQKCLRKFYASDSIPPQIDESTEPLEEEKKEEG